MKKKAAFLAAVLSLSFIACSNFSNFKDSSKGSISFESETRAAFYKSSDIQSFKVNLTTNETTVVDKVFDVLTTIDELEPGLYTMEITAFSEKEGKGNIIAESKVSDIEVTAGEITPCELSLILNNDTEFAVAGLDGEKNPQFYWTESAPSTGKTETKTVFDGISVKSFTQKSNNAYTSETQITNSASGNENYTAFSKNTFEVEANKKATISFSAKSSAADKIYVSLSSNGYTVYKEDALEIDLKKDTDKDGWKTVSLSIETNTTTKYRLLISLDGVNDICLKNITAVDSNIPVTSVGFAFELPEIMIAGEKLEVSATVLPSNATNKDVVFSVDNTSSAKIVTENGKTYVVALAAGKVKITCKSSDDPSKSKTSGEITIKPATGNVNINIGFEDEI